MSLLLALILLLVPTSIIAQDGIQQNTVSVSGVASVQRQPDRAIVVLAVETFAATASGASAENSRKMDTVISALRELGLERDQIRTIGFSINPEYDHSSTPRQERDERLLGYRARNTIQVRTDDIDQAGTIIEVALASGADRVTNLSFELRDPELARHEALRLALGKAEAEATTIADAIGRRLGPAIAVSTTGAFAPPQFIQARAMAAAPDMAMAAPPLEPGLLEVRAQVSVIYSLERQP